MLSGCAGIGQLALDATQEEREIVAVVKKVSTIQIKDWPTISGFIKGALEEDEMPMRLIRTIEELDAISRKYVDKTENKDSKFDQDYEKAYFVAKKFRNSLEIAIHLIQQYAPDVLIAISGML